MARNIYMVNAWIVDGNGTLSVLSGYPKAFDSKNYGDDPDKAYRRADGELSDVWSVMCKRDDRTVQTVIITDVNGYLMERKSIGEFTDAPEPESNE